MVPAMAVRTEGDEVVEGVLVYLRPRLDMRHVEARLAADGAPMVGLNEHRAFQPLRDRWTLGH